MLEALCLQILQPGFHTLHTTFKTRTSDRITLNLFQQLIDPLSITKVFKGPYPDRFP